ncbi:MAG: hypothetical protein F4203_02210 [Rhodobacteraceae bacterium]|nr:hypothetical protein [Paracoccaceae bacterium]
MVSAEKLDMAGSSRLDYSSVVIRFFPCWNSTNNNPGKAWEDQFKPRMFPANIQLDITCLELRLLQNGYGLNQCKSTPSLVSQNIYLLPRQ